MKSMKKAISLLLALVMCLGMLPMSAFAADVPEHEHSQNGWQCVYTEPVTKTDCTHQHDETCGYAAPTAGSPCTHEHNTDCGYAAAVEGVACTCGAVPDENGVVAHTDDCAYVEAKAEVPCKHQHDETCGYVEAKAEVPCTHVCSEESGCVTLVTEGYWTCTAPVAEEVPAQVKAFLDAVAALPAPETVTKDNAEAVGVQVNAVLDMYEGLIDAGLDEREDVAGALNTVYAVYNAVLAAEEIPEGGTYDVVTKTDNVTKTAYSQFNPNTQTSNTVSNGFAEDGRGTVVLTDENPTATDVAFCHYWGAHIAGWPNGFQMIAIERNTTPGVATATARTSENGLIVDFQKGSQTGTTTIVVGFTVTTLRTTANIASSGQTYAGFSGYLYYTVTNNGSGGTTEPGNKPEKPTDADVQDFYSDANRAIIVRCVDNQNHNGSMSRLKAGSYTIGEVEPYDGSNTDLSTSEWGWMCKIHVNQNYYLNVWHNNFQSTRGTHYLVDANKDVYAPFYYFNGGYCSYAGTNLPAGWYCLTEDAPIYVDITHQKPVEPTYTVTYTDGVAGETVFPDQGYEGLKAGDLTPAFEEGVKGTETLPNGTVQPKRDGFTFMGWNPTVAATVTGDVTYEATWQKNPDPQITKFVKKLVTSAGDVPADVAAALSGTTITYPGTDGKVHIPNGGTVTLLYKITVTGDVDAAYKVTDDNATRVGGDPMEGTIPTGGSAVIYVTRTFSARDINAQGKLVNIATVTPGKGNESSTSSQETTPAEEDGPVDNGNGIEVTKTRTAINGDTSKTTAKAGDTITWNITVKNNSNVEKTVTLTELAGVTLSKNPVTLEAGKSETVTATYVVQAADAGKTFTNTVTATTDENETATDTDDGTTITPEQITVTWLNGYSESPEDIIDTKTVNKGISDADLKKLYPDDPIRDGWTFDKWGDPETDADGNITITALWNENQVSNPALTGITKELVSVSVNGGTAVADPTGLTVKAGDTVKLTYTITVTGDEGAEYVVTDPDTVLVSGSLTGTLGDTLKAEITVTKTVTVNETTTVKNTAFVKPGDGTDPIDPDDTDPGHPSDEVTTEITVDNGDDGKGISITKTRVSIGGDASATVAEPGDVIKWEITVTNLSNVEKTVTLTEGLDGARLSVSSVTLAPAGQKDASKTVTATYTVAKADVGNTLVNTVVAKTDSPTEDKTATDEPGTPILGDKVVKMAIKNRFSAQNGDIIPYTVTVQNNSGFSLYGLDIMDDLTTHVYGVDANGAFVRDISTVTLTVVNVKATVGGKEVTLVPDSKNTDANAVNGTTSRKWTVLDRNTPMESGVPVVLTYDVKVAFTAGDYSGIANDGLRVDLKATASYGNWNSPETPATTARLMDTWEAPRYFGLAGMFAYDNQGSSDASSGTPDGTDPGQSGDGDGTNSDSSTATGGGSFTIPGGGGGTEQPEQPDPTPVDPVDPYEPVIPDEPTPVAPNPPEVEIDDERTPLASANGLNSVDHFAYIIGYDDDTVRPENKITRAEVATIFFRLMTDVYRAANWSTTNDFSDVAAGSWYNNAISTCAKAGLVNGYSDGTFKPDQSITRAEFATIAARFLDEEITGAGAEGFADIEGHWAETNILRAAEAGWVNGDNGRFRPDDYISRAEVMTIVNRMLNRVPDEDHLLPEMKTWSDNPKTAWYYEAVQEATNEHAYEWIDENVENWTELLTIRDWAALEKEWATAYSAGN